MRLTLFDLDHTLLHGDSDVLWCDFLIAMGILDGASFAPRNADMEARYRDGSVGVDEFANFYVSTLRQRKLAAWEPIRRSFLATVVAPRISGAAKDLVRQHLDAGDLVVMTTATNRYITELTARYFNIEHLIATEPETIDGEFTGRTTGTLNMRAGKVTRLHQWLQHRGQRFEHFQSTAYSDSINDLPLLEAVQRPVAVNADTRLTALAEQRGWPSISLRAASFV